MREMTRAGDGLHLRNGKQFNWTRSIWSNGLEEVSLETSWKGVCLLLHFRATTGPDPLRLLFGPASFHKKVVYFYNM